MSIERTSSGVKVGSFEHAELIRIRQIARLTPAQRVKLVCSMQSIVSRVAKTRGQA